jgi:hypothetical protein
MNDTPEDRKAVQSVINQIVIYPLNDFDGKMKSKDWVQAPAIPGPKSEGGGETKWVVPKKSFDQLGTVLDTVAPLPGEEPPVSGFWSMTLYNNDHFFHPNALKRYSLGTKNKNLRRGRRRLIDALRWREVAGRRQRVKLAARPQTATSRSTSAPTAASKEFSTARGSRRSFGESSKDAQYSAKPPHD